MLPNLFCIMAYLESGIICRAYWANEQCYACLVATRIFILDTEVFPGPPKAGQTISVLTGALIWGGFSWKAYENSFFNQKNNGVLDYDKTQIPREGRTGKKMGPEQDHRIQIDNPPFANSVPSGNIKTQLLLIGNWNDNILHRTK